MRRLSLALLLALAGCSSTEAATTPPAVPLETPTPSPTPTPAGPAKVGATQDSENPETSARITVLRLRQPLHSTIRAKAGREYVGAEVRTCVTRNASATEDVTVSWGPWSLTMPDETIAPALSSWSPDEFGVPLYPSGRVVRPGQCVRGWVPFEVPKGSRPRTVTYQPGAGDVLEWTVK